MKMEAKCVTVGASSGFDETVVEGEVVADAVAPPGPAAPEVGVVVQNVLVDVTEHQLGIGRTEDGHGDQSDVAVLRLGFLHRPVEGPRVELAPAHGSGSHGRVASHHRGGRVEAAGVGQEERAQIVRHPAEMERQRRGRRQRSRPRSPRSSARRGVRKESRRMSVAETFRHRVVV